ncbi:MAG: hypothetical protein KAG37_00855 [Flavobacteriales bacterium]|nr:hypothetical protein [Flavobacteriales bacterium]
MKNINIFIAVVLLSVSSTLVGQNITKLETKGYHVTFADDNKILVTSDSYTGLRVVDLKSSKEVVLSDARKSGKALFVDGKVVFGNRTSATLVDLDGKGAVTVEKTKQKSLRQAAFETNSSSSKKSSSELISANSINKLTAVELVYADGTSKIIKPLGENAQYLQTEISPNGKFIVLKQYGGHGYLMSDKGEMIVDLGYMERPKWAGNDYVTFHVTKDDHDKITQSDIFKIGINSRVKTNLTAKFSGIAMEPSSNSDGSKIVFNTIDGDIYVITK